MSVAPMSTAPMSTAPMSTAPIARALHAVGTSPRVALPQQQRTTVAVLAADPVTGAGIAGQLRFRPEVEVRPTGVPGSDLVADVVVVVTDAVTDEQIRAIRTATRAGSRTVLVASTLTGNAVLAAVDAGATAVMRRAEATVEGLAAAVRGAARGDGVMPPDLLGKLMTAVGSVGVARHEEPSARTIGGLNQRELDVLGLLAGGATTIEVARRLCYSERTIKNVIQAMTERLALRNRTHAVAYAVRAGLI